MNISRRKSHKGRISHLFSTSSLTLQWGNFGLFSTQGGVIKESEFKALELALKRKLKKNGVIYSRLNSGWIWKTQKPSEVRMGKGKGALDHKIVRVRPGSFLIEVLCDSPTLAKTALKVASSKLSLRTQYL